MSNLDHIQRSMFDAVRQPLTAAEGMRQRTRDGHSLRQSLKKSSSRTTA